MKTLEQILEHSFKAHRLNLDYRNLKSGSMVTVDGDIPEWMTEHLSDGESPIGQIVYCHDWSDQFSTEVLWAKVRWFFGDYEEISEHVKNLKRLS